MTMPWNKRTIRWMCDDCGHEHKFRWDKWDCFGGPIEMECDKCHAKHKGNMEPESNWVKQWRVL